MGASRPLVRGHGLWHGSLPPPQQRPWRRVRGPTARAAGVRAGGRGRGAGARTVHPQMVVKGLCTRGGWDEFWELLHVLVCVYLLSLLFQHRHPVLTVWSASAARQFRSRTVHALPELYPSHGSLQASRAPHRVAAGPTAAAAGPTPAGSARARQGHSVPRESRSPAALPATLLSCPWGFFRNPSSPRNLAAVRGASSPRRALRGGGARCEGPPSPSPRCVQLLYPRVVAMRAV